jgi:hypothetical protein
MFRSHKKVLPPRRKLNYPDPPYFDKPFQQYDHHPNCSVITDDELAQSVNGVWPSTNGQAIIEYTFSLPAFSWLYEPTGFYLRKINQTVTEIFQETVRFIISKIEADTNGIITFREVPRSFKTDFSPFFRGIYFAQTAPEELFTQDDSGAFTYIQFDNNGYIKRGIINMPTDEVLYEDITHIYVPDWIDYALTHETYHGLGQEHLQDYPDILSKLQNLTDGVFCSVMDYPSIVGTSISNCMTNCTPPYAVLPGPLDERSMRQAYTNGLYNRGYNKTTFYVYNGVELMIFFSLILIAYYITYEILAATIGKKFKVKKAIEAGLNITLLFLLIEMDTPLSVTIPFAVTSVMRLIPKRVLRLLRSYNEKRFINFLLNSHYQFFALVTTTSFSEGQVAAAIFIQLALNEFALLEGVVLGKAFGWTAVSLASNISCRRIAEIEELPDGEPAAVDQQQQHSLIELEDLRQNPRRGQQQQFPVPGQDDDLKITIPLSSTYQRPLLARQQSHGDNHELKDISPNQPAQLHIDIHSPLSGEEKKSRTYRWQPSPSSRRPPTPSSHGLTSPSRLGLALTNFFSPSPKSPESTNSDLATLYSFQSLNP